MTWKDAEIVAEAYMLWLGYDGAACTPPGSDSGIDVKHPRAVAQVKWRASATSRVDIQNLNGAASSHKQKLFFSRSFSKPAVAFATDRRIALFVLSEDAIPSPINEVAIKLAAAAPGGALNREDFAAEAAKAAVRYMERSEKAAAAAEARKDAAAQRRLDEQERRHSQQQRAREQLARQRERHERQLRASTGRASAPPREPLAPGGQRLRTEDCIVPHPESRVIPEDPGSTAVPPEPPGHDRLTTRPDSWWATALWGSAWLTAAVVVAAAWLIWQALLLVLRAVNWLRAARRRRRARHVDAAPGPTHRHETAEPGTAGAPGGHAEDIPAWSHHSTGRPPPASPTDPVARACTVESAAVHDDRFGQPFVVDPWGRSDTDR